MSGADSTTGPCPSGSLRPLLETLEDPAAAPAALTDALLTLTNRLTGEEGKEFASEVEKLFPQLYKIFKAYIPTENSELSSAALQALGFCVFNSKTAALLCESEIQELLSIVNSVAIKTVDKNTRTRALWVISKQSFPSDTVGKLVPSIISMLETVLNKGDLNSMVVEYEALNVIIRLIEQAPSHMEEQAVKWAKLIIPLVVHSAHKVQLRGATALEMGVPLLLQKQQEVAAVTEELMSTKIIPELQKLFASKNETYVLKLWPLFVKLLGKALHRSGSFINSLLQLEELGFRSGSPVVKKIAFIAWKSLIDNFALNPDILCSAKRLKLLMQPLSSIHVRTEALALTKLEVWWYLLMRLGPHLPAHFEQVCVPLIQSTLSLDSILQQGNSSRLAINQSLLTPGSAHKSGAFPFGTPGNQRMNLSSSTGVTAIPSIQLLGIEMLLHFFMGPEVLTFSKKNSIALSLEPLQHSVITSPSFFCKHASTFINAVQDGFIAVGKDASDTSLSAVWKEMVRFVKGAIESGNKRERQSSDVLTMLLQALKNIVVSNELPVLKSMFLIEITIKELPPKVLGSPAYQVADMDLLNGTPALFLIQLSFHEDLLKCYVQDERFFLNYESLVGCVLSGPTSPLTFSESVFTIVNQNAKFLENKEHLWRMWSIIVNPLTEWINQTNEVNQGDALEHNFNAVYSALLLPVNTIFPYPEFPLPTMKTLLRSWSELYRAFARCALLVATAEDNLCCEELCAKIISGLEDEADINQSILDGLAHITSVMVDCINFAPYGTKYQPSNRSPQMSADWSKKKKDPLGKLSSLIKLLVILLNSLQMTASKESSPERKTSIGTNVIVALQNIIGHISLPSFIRPLFRAIAKPLSAFYEKTKSSNVSKVTNGFNNKFEKLLAESISCLQSSCAGSFDSELLQELSPLLCIMLLHNSKQLRCQAAHFWNATFGKAVVLTYPEELKCVLWQAKQKSILLLPGFENTGIAGESNGTYSDSQTENSQWDAKISGIEVNPSGKRDSLLAQTNELKQKSINSPVTPAKQMKLENSLTKTNKKNLLLEEENTIDFVFIPPKTKERVLTEHQKEVLRTKRIDIPTMYNNLDASQDTTLFSQYTQSQEDCLDKAASVDEKEESEKEENKTMPQDENTASELLGNAREVTESGKTDVLPENNNSTNAKQLTTFGKQTLDPNCEKLETCAPKSVSGETSVLDNSLNECTSNVSSCSSASSDVISGTPQPVSRRQSFITLEKFNSSENRPFTPTTFTVSGTSTSTPLLAKQQSTIASDVSSNGIPDVENSNTFQNKVEEATPRSKKSNLEILGALETYVKIKKMKEENKTNSKLQPENTLGIKKSSLRQSKTDNLEEKTPKLSHLHQEKNKVESPANVVEDKCELPGETQESEHLLDIPSQVELNAVGCTIENKQILDNVVETKAGTNLDSKENTPPELTLAAAAISNVGPSPQVSPNPKALRRSLRRKPEASEGASDSPDKENSQQKKDGRKDSEKVLPKKISQSKETSAQKLKSVPEKTIDAQGSIKKEINVHGSRTTEGMILKESHVSKSIQEETSITTEKSEGSQSSGIIDLQVSVPDTTGEKPKGFPRYQTRRTSQGLLTSIENSESDSSETREEGTKRKRAGRWKNKSSSLESSSLESQMKEVLESQELHAKPAIDIQTMQSENKDVEHSDEHMEIALVSNVTDEERERNTLPLSECSGLEQDMDCRDASDTEKTASRMLTRSTSESVLESRQRTTVTDKYSDASCNITSPAQSLESGGYTAISASSSPEKSSETTECQHKRSKRTRKSKCCNCCGELPSPQLGKSTTETKKESSPELKLKEPKKVANKATVSLPNIAVADSQFPERLSMEPCAASTPLSSISHSSALKDSHEDIQPEEYLLGADATKEELQKSCVKDGSDTSVAENLDCAGLGEAILEPSSIDSDTKEYILQYPALKADPEPGDVKMGDSNQSGHPEGRTDVERSVKQPEEIKASETEVGIIQNIVDKTPESVTKLTEHQEQDAESDAAGRSVEYEVSALTQKENNSDSPLKFREIYALSVAKISESLNGVQTRCIWSPSASPSTSILKRGLKRQKEEDSPSPANKSRRVSFANPIYQEELADDIDRRSPVVRTHSSNGSYSFRSINSSPNHQAKLITTPTKGSLSPGSRSHKYKSSKKCLITEMVKEPLPSPTECIYPALVGCKAPVDTILPQITSNICRKLNIRWFEENPAQINVIICFCETHAAWARGLGQLIRAKNIRTVGDLSSLTSAEIKTLPIRSPKVSNVKRALKGYHDQQVRSRGFEENGGLDDAEKAVSVIDEKSCSTNEDKMETDLSEPVSSTEDEQSTTDLFAQISILAPQFTSENLINYSGSELFEMQEKLYSMTNSIMKNLQARWKSPTQESTV